MSSNNYDSDSLKKTEELLDSEINNAVKSILARLQTERDRLVTAARGSANWSSVDRIEFAKNVDFDGLVLRLLTTPFGNLEFVENSNNSEIKTAIKPESMTLLSAPSNAPDLMVKTAAQGGSPYEVMQVVATFNGEDAFHERLTGPTNIITLPGRNGFALMHNNHRISYFSSSAELISTVLVHSNKMIASSRNNPSPSALALCSSIDQLFFMDRDVVKSIATFVLPKTRGGAVILEAKDRFVNSSGPLHGLAICEKTRTVFTSFGSSLAAYSLPDFSFSGCWLIDSPATASQSLVLGVRDQQLFYRGDSGTRLFTVPIAQNGKLVKLVMSESKPFGPKFDFIRAMTFDPEGRVLVADKGRQLVQVLSYDGEETLSVFRTPDGFGNFLPTGIAVLTCSNDNSNKTNNNSFFFEKCMLRSSRVVVTLDYYANQIIFFASLCNNELEN